MLKSIKMLRFTTLYRSGQPFPTGAVVCPVSGELAPAPRPSGFAMEQKGEETRLRFELSPRDRVYGFGEMLGGINKRGRRYRLYATDDPHHTPDKMSLYGSQPVCIVAGDRTFGFFLDFPGEIRVDLGFTHTDQLEVTLPSKNFDLYIFEDREPLRIVEEYLRLTGTPYCPPRWAFGYQQCRYSYPTAERLREIAANFRERDIPCDVLYLDIDYMEDFKVFTVDRDRFPDLAQLARDLGADGFKLVCIVDPGVKIEKGYSVYEAGKKQGFFCKTEAGEDFVGVVWPGLAHFPDFLNADCRKWWGTLYRDLIDMGVKAFWNDMNEPAIFFSAQGREEFLETADQFRQCEEIGSDSVEWLSRLTAFWKSERDHLRFFHVPSKGKSVLHRDVHNLYGTYMAKATAEGLDRLLSGERHFLLTRSTYPGSHRYAAIWTGDNHSWWEHLTVEMQRMVSLNLAGFFFCGSDVGGFSGDASAELLIRWSQLGCFSPLFRNHACKGTRDQEPWAFDEETERILRDTIRLRYALLPYLYSEFLRSVLECRPFLKPLSLEFSTAEALEIEDQFLCGDSLMIAPIHRPNGSGRFVYFPGQAWLRWNASRSEERGCVIEEEGGRFVRAGLSEIPVMLHQDRLVVLGEPGNYIGQTEGESLIALGFVTERTDYTLLIDDGVSFGYREGKLSRLLLQVEKIKKGFRCSASARCHADVPMPYRRVRFEIYNRAGECAIHEVEIE